MEAVEKAKTSAGTNSISNRIAKYGDELGQKMYDETRKKMSQNWNPKSASHQKFGSSVATNKLFLRVYKYCRRLGYKRNDFMFAANIGEMFIRTDENIYFYDFCVKPLKIIIEYNGEHVHPNIEQMDETQYNSWRHAYTKEKAEIVYKHDCDKMHIAKTSGFKYCIVWSKDKNAFNTVTKFIKEHHDCKNY